MEVPRQINWSAVGGWGMGRDVLHLYLTEALFLRRELDEETGVDRAVVELGGPVTD